MRIHGVELDRIEPAAPAARPAAHADVGAVVVAPSTAAAADARAAHAARLDALKADVQAGRYPVDRQRLAEKIFDDEVSRRRPG